MKWEQSARYHLITARLSSDAYERNFSITCCSKQQFKFRLGEMIDTEIHAILSSVLRPAFLGKINSFQSD